MYQSPNPTIVAKTVENWRVKPEISGGGLFHDLAPHQLDILCWLFGEPLAIAGKSYNQGSSYAAPDVTYLNAEFRNKIYLNGFWSFHVAENCTEDLCELLGDKGKISFSFFRNPVIEVVTEESSEQISLSVPEHVQQPMIADVVRYFRGEAVNPSPLDEACWSMRMMDYTL
jgi:predicted dehydrogenase